MANRTMNAIFQQRRDTAANWESKNPIILDGEQITVLTNAGAVRHKTGDGIKTYKQLPFDDEPLYNALADKSDKSSYINATLSVNAWNNGQQTISVNGLGANQNGYAGLAQNISEDEFEAAIVASIFVSGQAEGTLTFSCYGAIPQIDIPIIITFFD